MQTALGRTLSHTHACFSSHPQSASARPAQSRLVGVQRRGATHSGTRLHAWFNIGKLRSDSEDAGIYGSQTRDDYSTDDIEHYFNYMGMLAMEGTYDRLKQLQAVGHPVDVLLLMAASENDTPKVAELLRAGADINIKDPDGKSPMELATSEAVLELLKEKANA